MSCGVARQQRTPQERSNEKGNIIALKARTYRVKAEQIDAVIGKY